MSRVKLDRAVMVVLAILAGNTRASATLVLPPVLAPQPPPAVFTPAPESPQVRFALPKYELSSLDRETVAACLVLESASQGELGMRGVMAVIRNRAGGRPELFAFTVLREKQFSALNKHTSGRESLWRVIQRAKADRTWTQALALVDAAQRDDWHDPTGGATHYTRAVERTAWTRTLAKTVTIGAHSFYR